MPTVTVRKVKTTAWACTCERCSHEWMTLGAEPPTRCPKCKARNFGSPPKWKRPDRTRRALARQKQK
ncbi:MAG: hypothetical protein KJ067_23500 [Vicinamibacteria bacterium]|nr:hypothetical protein [Vicinamibacteria bacterium]